MRIKCTIKFAGKQDCLLDRYQLCVRHRRTTNDAGAAGSAEDDPNAWFDFTTCLYKNQIATDNITDHRHAFDLTVRYCSALTGQASHHHEPNYVLVPARTYLPLDGATTNALLFAHATGLRQIALVCGV